MALTPTQEAQVIQLVNEQAALLSLADNEATIISKLGATKVNLSSLGAAASFGDTDIMLIRQGTTDLSIAGSIVKSAVAVPDASETVKGKVELATSGETITGTSTTLAVHPAGLASAIANVGGSYSLNQVVTGNTTFSITHVGRAIEINSVSATAHNLPAASAYASGKAISFANINTGIATFNRAGSDTITGCNLAGATALPLNNGETVTLVSDGVDKWYVAASNVTFFGTPQTWQNVTGSRVLDATYTNSTGRDISINILCITTSGTNISVLTEGVTLHGSAENVNGSSVAITATIRSGKTYSVPSSGKTLSSWLELR